MNDISRFYRRREMRLLKRGIRLDADNDENGAKKGGHGNTRLPYGLCQREGIDIGKDWTPKDAWNALEGKGYSAKEEYEGLKQGKKAGSSKKAKSTKKIDGSMFPAKMSEGSYAKTTNEYMTAINDICKNDDVMEFLSCAGSELFPNFKVQRKNDGTGCKVRTTYYRSTGKIAGVDVIIPEIRKGESPEQKNTMVRSFIHEFTHFIDMIGRRDKSGNAYYSEKDDKLKEAIKKEKSNKPSSEVLKIFGDFNKQYDELYDNLRKDLHQANFDAVKEMFGDEASKYIVGPEGSEYVSPYSMPYKKYHEFTKLRDKKERELKARWARESRSIMDGVSALEGLYADTSMGNVKEVRFKHDVDYTSDIENATSEALAGYMSLAATRPDLLAYYEKDYPETAKRLKEMVVEIPKFIKGARV